MPLSAELRQMTFNYMGAFVICFLTYKVLEGNYTMVAPHLKTLFWSAYIGLGLSRLKRTLVSVFGVIGGLQFRWKLAIYLALFGVYVAVFVPVLLKGFSTPQGSVANKFILVLMALLVMGVLMAPLLLDRDTLATLLLILVSGCLALVLLGAIASTSLTEIVRAASLLQDFLASLRQSLPGSSAQLWAVVEQRCHSLAVLNVDIDGQPVLRPGDVCAAKVAQLRANFPSVAESLLAVLQGQVPVLVRWSSDLAGSLASSLGELAFSGVLFMTCLYYFVKFDHRIGAELGELSPFSSTQSASLYRTVLHNTVRTYELTMELALLNFATTALAFTYAGSDVIWLPATLSGFLAIVPVFSSWLVWLPASLVLVARDGPWSLPWAVMVLLHLGAWAGSSWLYVRPHGHRERPEIVGLSIVLGLYAFGPYGAVWGPILSAALLALVAFYKDATRDPDAPAGPAPPPSAAGTPLSTALPGTTPASAPAPLDSPRAPLTPLGALSTHNTPLAAGAGAGAGAGAVRASVRA